jgi:hypothetical protein
MNVASLEALRTSWKPSLKPTSGSTDPLAAISVRNMNFP